MRRTSFISLLFIVLVFGLLSSGCAGTDDVLRRDAETARLLYLEGMEHLTDSDFEAAITDFTEVSQYPRFMKYAALAKVRLGDTLFYQGRYLEAVEVYEEFRVLYPRNPNIPYSDYMAARSLYERIPADVALFSPAERLDMTRVLQARDRLQGFIADFPDSPYTLEAAEMLRSVRLRLFRYHRYIADFYVKRDVKRAVAGRLWELAVGYPEWGTSYEDLRELSSLTQQIDEPVWNERVQKILHTRFPPEAFSESSVWDADMRRLEELGESPHIFKQGNL